MPVKTRFVLSLTSTLAASRNLDSITTNLEPRLQLVQETEKRVQALVELNRDVDQRIAKQLGRQTEIESMSSNLDGLGVQLGELSRLASTLHTSKQYEQAQEKLDSLDGRLVGALERVDRSETLGAQLEDSEGRLRSISGQLDTLGQSVEQDRERLDQLHRDSEVLERMAADLVEQRLALAEAQQATEQRTESMQSQLEDLEQREEALTGRQSALGDFESRMTDFEGKLKALDTESKELDRRMDTLGSRQALVQRLKQQVERLLAATEEGQQQVAALSAAEGRVDDVRVDLERVSRRSADIEQDLERLAGKLPIVEEAEQRIDALHHVLGDVNVHLEAFQGQKTLIDNLAKKLSQLELENRRAEATLQQLREGRSLASQVQHGIQSLRSRPAPNEASVIRIDSLQRKDAREETQGEKQAEDDSDPAQSF